MLNQYFDKLSTWFSMTTTNKIDFVKYILWKIDSVRAHGHAPQLIWVI